MKSSTRATLTVAVLLATLLVLAAPAAAHETATAGKAVLELGWGTEPAYVGQLNTIQLIATYQDGDPVSDPGARLTAKVSYGD